MIKMNLRSGIYETNSSSSHTLVVTNKRDYIEPSLIEKSLSNTEISKCNDTEFYIVPDAGYFGSDFAIIEDWNSKFKYLLGSFKYDNAMLETISEVVSEYIPNCKGILIDDIDFTPYMYNEEVLYDEWLSESLPTVDHQSQEIMPVLINYMKENNYTLMDALREVIFSNKFVIITDSDCSDVVCDLVEAGLLDREKFEKILYITYTSYDKPGEANFLTLEEYKKLLLKFRGD